ncbi:MAG: site-2 protease family protein [Clostridia bacterium]|nr:site-2 protease family protein [Clostridia bacterium]
MGLFAQLQENPVGFLIGFLYAAPAVLIALTLHELSHGYVALRCGDPTAQMMGRLTFNPLRHLNLFGTICMFLFGVGWANPVPVNPRNFRNFRRDDFLVSIAGIATNLLLYIFSVIISSTIIRIMFTGEVFTPELGSFFLSSDGMGYHYLQAGQENVGFDLFQILGGKQLWLQHVLRFLTNFGICNLSLALFNLLPFPPLDGYRLFNNILFKNRIRIPYRVMQFLIIGLLVVNYATNWIGKIISSVVYAVQSGILFVILPLFGMS